MGFDNIVQEVTIFLPKGKLGNLVYKASGIAVNLSTASKEGTTLAIPEYIRT